MKAPERPRARVGAFAFSCGLVLIAGSTGLGCSDDGDKVITGPPIVSPFVSIRQELNADGTVRAEIQESVDGTQRKLFGEFRSDVLIDAAHTWILDRPTFIGEEQSDAAAPTYVGPTLTIEAGTTILCRSGLPPSMLVIRRGARIVADGTATAPIVFTSARPVGQRAVSDWGGLVINGRSIVNERQADGVSFPLGEGNSGSYGGTDPDDSSGVLRYVRVEFTGAVFSDVDELNGIAFQGVGRGTVVDFIQAHKASDDGVEFFGGTVDVKHVLVTGSQDDAFDWTFGWSGRAQFVVLQQNDGGADNGIEADNNGSSVGVAGFGGNDSQPRSRPTISNLTIVGPRSTSAQSALGMRLRAGTTARISNAIVTRMNGQGLRIESNATLHATYTSIPLPSGGTVAAIASTNITGTGTTFTADLAVGSLVSFGSQPTTLYRVTAIPSATQLTLSSPYTGAVTGSTSLLVRDALTNDLTLQNVWLVNNLLGSFVTSAIGPTTTQAIFLDFQALLSPTNSNTSVPTAPFPLLLVDPTNATAPNFRLDPASPAAAVFVAPVEPLPGAPFFVTVPYAGAIGADAGSDWTTFVQN
jgi:hypothetical protein